MVAVSRLENVEARTIAHGISSVSTVHALIPLNVARIEIVSQDKRVMLASVESSQSAVRIVRAHQGKIVWTATVKRWKRAERILNAHRYSVVSMGRVRKPVDALGITNAHPAKFVMR